MKLEVASFPPSGDHPMESTSPRGGVSCLVISPLATSHMRTERLSKPAEASNWPSGDHTGLEPLKDAVTTSVSGSHTSISPPSAAEAMRVPSGDQRTERTASL